MSLKFNPLESTPSMTDMTPTTNTGRKSQGLTAGINFRLTPADQQALDDAVARTGHKNKTRVIRDLIHGVKVYERTPAIDVEWLTELRAIGNNLNQATKALNTKLLEKEVSPETLFGIKANVKALESLMQEIIKKMMASKTGDST